jgi:hypothetical protein
MKITMGELLKAQKCPADLKDALWIQYIELKGEDKNVVVYGAENGGTKFFTVRKLKDSSYICSMVITMNSDSFDTDEFTVMSKMLEHMYLQGKVSTLKRSEFIDNIIEELKDLIIDRENFIDNEDEKCIFKKDKDVLEKVIKIIEGALPCMNITESSKE